MDASEQDMVTASALLQSGFPFCQFPEYQLEDLPAEGVMEWVEETLDAGRPFVVRGFDRLDTWDAALLTREALLNLLSLDTILVRNCQTGRDIRVSTQELLRSERSGRKDKRRIRESLYAKDLQCPPRWTESLDALLPGPFRYFGSLDLFRVLPKQIAPEVFMAYVGTRNSFSGFHRCFSGTVALNFLLEVDGTGPGTVCYGTDRSSQEKYNLFTEKLGRSPHTDWVKILPAQMRLADFPIYVYDQRPGDLVIFPSATAHQVYNVAPSVTKVVWNILHLSSLMAFQQEVQPAYQHQCHADTGRIPLVPINSLHRASESIEHYRRRELTTLADIFQNFVDDQIIEREIDTPMRSVDPQGDVIECNFCGSAIWNRHLHCDECSDFDICMTCFISGRSCKHTSAYSWAQIVSIPKCKDLLKHVWNMVGLAPRHLLPASSKSLGTLAAQAVLTRQDSTERLCHLCRDNHPQWKGTSCERCSSFFCYRGLFRHFDIETISLLRHGEPWTCPKCSKICNCRCCHFPQPYQRKHRPAGQRVKAIDSRGSIYGFMDNVFDHKRGKRPTTTVEDISTLSQDSPQRHKRPRTESSEPWIDWSSRSRSRQLTNRTSTSPDGLPPISELPGMGSTNSRIEAPVRISDLLVQQGSLPTKDNADRRATTSPSSSAHNAYPRHEFTSGGFIITPTRPEEPRSHTVAGPETSAALGLGDIPSLEKRLEALRTYANDLLELSLTDSHAQVLDRIQQLQGQLEAAKRKKAEALLSSLRTDFPDLADVAMEEARRRGVLQ